MGFLELAELEKSLNKAGASGDFPVFQPGFIIVFDLAGEAVVRKSGIDGDQAAVATGFFQVVGQDGGQLDLGFEFKDFLFQNLGGTEVCRHGRLRIFDDVAFRLEVGQFLIGLVEAFFEFRQPSFNEFSGFQGRLFFFVDGNLVVNFNQVVEDVLRFLRVGGGERHFQQAGVFGIRAGDGEIRQQGARRVLRRDVSDDDGLAVPVRIHYGSRMDGDRSEG